MLSNAVSPSKDEVTVSPSKDEVRDYPEDQRRN